MVENLILKCRRKYYRKYYYNKVQKERSKHHVHICQTEFMDLYAGPEYCFYYKSANAILMVFITLIFGSIFPILYVIALFSLGVQYVIERLSLTYFYRIPPKYDVSVTKQTLRLMTVAPLLSLMFTFWVYTNKQMFEN